MTSELHAAARVAGPPIARSARPARRLDRHRSAIVALGLIGGAAAVAGSTLPWLSLYAGLHPITGLDGLNGRVLAGLGGFALAAALAHAIRGGQGTRWLLGMSGFALAAFAGWLGVQLLGTVSELSADPLLVARLEPGLAVSIVGGSLVFATLFVPPARDEPTVRPALSARHLVVTATLLAAGAVHLALTPEHVAGSVLLGVGFLGTGIAQLLLAAFVARTRSVAAVQLSVVVSAFALAALASAVTIGLPGLPHGGSLGPLGPVESLDDVGLLTGVLEAATLAVGISLLRSGRNRSTAPAPSSG